MDGKLSKGHLRVRHVKRTTVEIHTEIIKGDTFFYKFQRWRIEQIRREEGTALLCPSHPPRICRRNSLIYPLLSIPSGLKPKRPSLFQEVSLLKVVIFFVLLLEHPKYEFF